MEHGVYGVVELAQVPKPEVPATLEQEVQHGKYWVVVVAVRRECSQGQCLPAVQVPGAGACTYTPVSVCALRSTTSFLGSHAEQRLVELDWATGCYRGFAVQVTSSPVPQRLATSRHCDLLRFSEQADVLVKSGKPTSSGNRGAG